MQPNAGRAKFERYEDWGDLGGDWGRFRGDWGDETQAETKFSDHYVFGAVLGF